MDFSDKYFSERTSQQLVHTHNLSNSMVSIGKGLIYWQNECFISQMPLQYELPHAKVQRVQRLKVNYFRL